MTRLTVDGRDEQIRKTRIELERELFDRGYPIAHVKFYVFEGESDISGFVVVMLPEVEEIYDVMGIHSCAEEKIRYMTGRPQAYVTCTVASRKRTPDILEPMRLTIYEE